MIVELFGLAWRVLVCVFIAMAIENVTGIQYDFVFGMVAGAVGFFWWVAWMGL